MTQTSFVDVVEGRGPAEPNGGLDATKMALEVPDGISEGGGGGGRRGGGGGGVAAGGNGGGGGEGDDNRIANRLEGANNRGQRTSSVGAGAFDPPENEATVEGHNRNPMKKGLLTNTE
jgi:hypothetical protein